VLSILATIAKQERIRLSERTIAGLEKARREGRIGGRPTVVVDRDRIARMDEEGFTLGEIAEEMGISSATACRILKGYRRPQNPAAGLSLWLRTDWTTS
jgi:DNA invertase Pin-like site-specific DNA recombinase